MESSEEEKVQKMMRVFDQFPNEKRKMMVVIVYLWKEITKRSFENKMTKKNLSIVFGPTVMRPISENIIDDPLEYKLSTENRALVVELIIQNAKKIFPNYKEEFFRYLNQFEENYNLRKREKMLQIENININDHKPININLESSKNRNLDALISPRSSRKSQILYNSLHPPPPRKKAPTLPTNSSNSSNPKKIPPPPPSSKKPPIRKQSPPNIHEETPTGNAPPHHPLPKNPVPQHPLPKFSVPKHPAPPIPKLNIDTSLFKSISPRSPQGTSPRSPSDTSPRSPQSNSPHPSPREHSTLPPSRPEAPPPKKRIDKFAKSSHTVSVHLNELNGSEIEDMSASTPNIGANISPRRVQKPEIKLGEENSLFSSNEELIANSKSAPKKTSTKKLIKKPVKKLKKSKKESFFDDSLIKSDSPKINRFSEDTQNKNNMIDENSKLKYYSIISKLSTTSQSLNDKKLDCMNFNSHLKNDPHFKTFLMNTLKAEGLICLIVSINDFLLQIN